MNLINLATNPLLRTSQLFSLKRPIATHWRPASCDEVRCPQHLNGWRTDIDEASSLGQKQAYYIRAQSGRRFREAKAESGLTEFYFEPGQRCFREHKVPTGQDPLLIHQRLRHGVIAGTARYEWNQWRDTFNREMEAAARR